VTHIDQAVLPYLAFYPLPNVIGSEVGDTGLFNTTGVERLTENYVTLRGDHHFSDKDSFAASWFYDRAPLTMPDSLVESLTQNFTLRQMYSLEETHVFSPTLVNTARAGFSRVRATVTQPVSALNPLAKDPSFGILPGQFAPAINIDGGIVSMLGALGSVSADLLTWNSFQFYDDAFVTRGAHSLKFGFAVEHMQNSEFSGASRQMDNTISTTCRVFSPTSHGASTWTIQRQPDQFMCTRHSLDSTFKTIGVRART